MRVLLARAVDTEEAGAADEDGQQGAEVEDDEFAVLGHGAVAEEGEVMDKGPGDEDVAEAEGGGPAGPQPEDEQDGADKVREEGDEEGERRSEVKEAGEMSHEGKPVGGALFPSVAKKERGAGGDAKEGEAEAGGCGQEIRAQEAFEAAHVIAFQWMRRVLDIRSAMLPGTANGNRGGKRGRLGKRLTIRARLLKPLGR